MSEVQIGTMAGGAQEESMEMILLKILDIAIPESDLPAYAIRFNRTADGDVQTSLYIHGKRTTLPWHLELHIDNPGGGDSSG
jgi:hypothetical protein